MNIKQQYSIRDLGTPSVFSGTNILNLKEVNGKKYWYINGQFTDISTDQIPAKTDNTLDFFNRDTIRPVPAERNVENYIFQKNLELLNQRISAIHKELTYWDLYKLTASVDNPEDLESTFAGLSVGQSMVINCSTFSKGNINYARGDVIVKTSENQNIKIDAVANGLYYPSAIKKVDAQSNIYTLTYAYYPGQPNNNSTTIALNESVNISNGLPKTINIGGLADTSGVIYGQFFTLPNIEDFNVLYEDGDTSKPIIHPIVKVFSEDLEEVSIDSSTLHITINTTNNAVKQWHIAFSPEVPPIAAYIQVK